MFDIRPTQEADISQTVALLKSSWERTYDPLIGRENRILISNEKHKARVLLSEIERNEGESLVALDEQGKVIGHIGGEIKGGDRIFFVDRLHVEPEYFGTGVATKLSDALGVAIKDRADAIELTVLKGNDRALAFYLKYGFEIVTGENEDDGLGGIQSTLMRYNLNV